MDKEDMVLSQGSMFLAATDRPYRGRLTEFGTAVYGQPLPHKEVMKEYAGDEEAQTIAIFARQRAADALHVSVVYCNVV